MNRNTLSALFLGSALFFGACSSPSSNQPQEADATAANAPDSANAPATGAAPDNARPADPKLEAMIDRFPELSLPYTITLTGDSFDKAEGKKAIKLALDEMRDYLGFEFTEDGYTNSFMGITPVGRIVTDSGILLLYVSEWDGSCPTLSSTFLPNNGGPRPLDLEPTSCGPCAVVTGPITFTKDTVTKKLTKEDDCGNEGNPSKWTSETTYSLTGDGLTKTKESPWTDVK